MFFWGPGGRAWRRRGPWVFAFGFGPWFWDLTWAERRGRRALLRELEAYREFLEEELEDVKERIEELKRELGEQE